MEKKEEQLTVKVPKGWNKKLDGIAAPLERTKSYIVRKAVEQVHPELKEVSND